MSKVVELMPDRASADKLQARAFRDLECKVCDLDRMGEITERLVADWCQEVTNERCLELANFAVQHLADMLREFRTNYDAAWHDEPQRGGS
ncbi:hypothetical protein [Bradyrhizobium sp. 150]|uniref:hypothetical protein n=1 Tax=Bradyrhizobium sp. 150 TaxID=2782625 RepID=UPI001FFA7096|nr:hypothetical protein [Bradyrhizobium sp. 150]MCK1672785.1 hypothetical protein [Bradyrhizobium sp. 150]